MNCSICGKALEARGAGGNAGESRVILSLTHADVEAWAFRCPKCQVVLCGSCSLPGWEKMKRERGLSGRTLAAELEADPGALFGEEPHCPRCQGRLEEVPDAQLGPSAPAGRGPKLRFSFRELVRRVPLIGVSLAVGVAGRLLFGTFALLVLGVLFGIVLFGASLTSAYEADCPVCGEALAALDNEDRSPPRACPKCRRFLKVSKEGRLVAVDDNDVFRQPWYSIPFNAGDALTLPQRCCGCGGSAVRAETVAFRAQGGRGVSLDVPHCARCAAGANAARFCFLYEPREGPRARPARKGALRVKSYSFYRECLRLNGLWPQP